jgi:hypothetical protein
MSRAVCCLSDTAAGTAWRANGTVRSTQHAVRSPAAECITQRQPLSNSTQHAVQRPSDGVYYTATNIEQQHAACSPQHAVRRPSDGVYYTATNIEQQHAARSPQPAAHSAVAQRRSVLHSDKY